MKSKAKKGREAVEQYTHDGKKRPNNPPVGLVTPETDPDSPKKVYAYDPRLDPQLIWSGKKENTEFAVDTVSLHVHERIDPSTILEKAMKPKQCEQQTMLSFFDAADNNPPLRDAIEFYQHGQNWSNRLIAGDSLLVMNSLLEKEGMEGRVQMVYMDPPYGIKYGSNFQPFVNKRDVKDGKDEDLTQEPEMIKAFRDTWELKLHSYLSYLRDRLFMVKQLLTESGSVFVQISDKNMHHVRELMDEVFGTENFVCLIVMKTRSTSTSRFMSTLNDYIVWYAKSIDKLKYHQLFEGQNIDYSRFSFIEDGGKIVNINRIEENQRKNFKPFSSSSLNSTTGGASSNIGFEYKNKTYFPATGRSWRCSIEGLKILEKQNRIFAHGNSIRFKHYYDDFPFTPITNLWTKQISEQNKIFVVQTGAEALQRCILMTTDPGDLVLDPTCGSGTTAHVAEKWGRRWIACDTSRVALVLTKQRLMTSMFGYFKLFRSEEGISSGFDYNTVPHITLGSLANNEEASVETLYDSPKIDRTKIRVSGPFTVESVPAPTAKSIDVMSAAQSHHESGLQNSETHHQQQWRDELFKTGIRGKSGQKIEFTRVESHPATKWIHADAETKESPKRVVISFGPEHAPLEQRQVALAIEEAQTLIPKPKMVIFAAMQFDPEAAKDIDELNWPKVTVLKVEMNKDLLTGDLKRKRSSNESFWLMGQPDVDLEKTDGGKYAVRVNGFDYYNTKTEEIESGDSSRIAMWMLDTDYDGRSVYPQQVFFPMAGKGGGWGRLAKTLQAQIDEELIAKYQGTESIQFEAGPNKRAAVKIVDDRGIESLKIIDLE